LLDEDAWESDYETALALHTGAAEAAYLSARWDRLDGYIDQIKTRGRGIVDQLRGWEVHIDSCIARKAYADAIDAAIEALGLLDISLPASPSEAEVGAAVEHTMAILGRVGPDGVRGLAIAGDPEAVAAIHILGRITSAAYFAAPTLLPLLACRQVSMSVEHGLDAATAYALSVYGIVLNTLGMHREAHTWGTVALELLERFDDPVLATRTSHVVHNLVCIWTAPISGEVRLLRDVVDVGRACGEVEYAGYAAHGYIHNAMYAGWPLEPLYREALELGDFMRGHDQVNALHVHEPFEAMLRCLRGLNDDPRYLDGGSFDESSAMAAAEAAGSSAGVGVLLTVMGMTRYLFGDAEDAHRCFTRVRPLLPAMPSVWHVPMVHQFAALSIYSLPASEREAHLADADSDIEALGKMAEQGPENFAHRVALLEAERARVTGDRAAALAGFDRAIELARVSDFVNDIALAHELAARCAEGAEAERHRSDARAAYERWGAVAKLDALLD
jgi:predicted ATPase